jgi:hypothetical protein
MTSTIIVATKVPTPVVGPLILLFLCCMPASRLLATSHRSGLPSAFVTVGSPGGSTPDRFLYETSSNLSGDLLRIDGTSPMRALCERSRSARLLGSLSSLGIGPVTKFVERFSVLCCVRFPGAGGIP